MDRSKLRIVQMPTLGQQWQEAINAKDAATQAKQEAARIIQSTREKVQQMIREGNKNSVLVIKRDIRTSDLASGNIASFAASIHRKDLSGEEFRALLIKELQGALLEIMLWCEHEHLCIDISIESKPKSNTYIFSIEVCPHDTPICKRPLNA